MGLFGRTGDGPIEETLRGILPGMGAEERSRFMIDVEVGDDVQTAIEIAGIVVDVERGR